MIYTETALVRHVTAWCQKHLGQHDSAEYLAYHRAFAAFLETKREEQSRAHDNAGLFGMSGAGGCLRANALKRAGVQGKPDDGDSMVTFEIGHLLECMALAVLGAAGFAVTRMQETIRLEPAFASAIDGVLEAGPVKLDYPLVLSVKTASYKSSSPPRGNYPAKRYGFAQLPLDGVRKAQPGWFTQSQLEMAATGIPRSLVLVVSKDMIAAFRGDAVFEQSGSLSWYAEVLQAEPNSIRNLKSVYRETLEQAEKDVREVSPAYGVADGFVILPRPGDVASGWKGENAKATGTFNPCFGCRYGGQPEICK